MQVCKACCNISECVASKTESNGESVRSKEKECQPTGDCAKSESAENDGQEKSSPKEKEEKKEVEKEEEQQQGVKRRVEEEAGGTSRKVVRQSRQCQQVRCVCKIST